MVCDYAFVLYTSIVFSVFDILFISACIWYVACTAPLVLTKIRDWSLACISFTKLQMLTFSKKGQAKSPIRQCFQIKTRAKSP
jgi:hypothetical protein